ncbi:venom protease-like, partial [Lucilia cuprina]|uniref:venom protease-like n=1 Tax=Lucilia cuprina TaxID=7375 RepID=UPI001F054AB9
MKTFYARFTTLCIISWLNFLPIIITAKSHKQNEPIVSGKQAALGQFPWHVLLKKDKNADVWCGGSIITNKWVLTAAHCLYRQRTILMVFGTIESKKSEFSMTSNKFVIYPAYDDNNVFDDIGLIALPNPLTFSPNIQAIDLVTAAEAAKNDFLGAEATICGFGRTVDNVDKSSEWLLWTSVEIVNNTICEVIYDEPVEDTVICAKGYKNSKQSPCDGDSGGALVWKNKANKFVQIGVYSFSKEDACSQFPS